MFQASVAVWHTEFRSIRPSRGLVFARVFNDIKLRCYIQLVVYWYAMVFLGCHNEKNYGLQIALDFGSQPQRSPFTFEEKAML